MLQFLKKTNVHKVFFLLHFYLETYTMTKKHNIMYTISHLSDILLPSSTKLTLYLKENIYDEFRCPLTPHPILSDHYTNYLHSLFTSLLNLSVYVLEEDLLMGTQCPYGFLSATLSALEVTLLSWTVGLFDGLAMLFCQYKKARSTFRFQYTLTVIIYE